MPRWSAPKYRPSPFKSAESVAKDYRALAKAYLKEARYWEEAARSDARPVLKKQWRARARTLRVRAGMMLAKAKRFSGVSSRSVERSPGHRKAWEVWTVGDGHDGAMFVEAYADKGEAQRKIVRLRRSHPYQRYSLRRRKQPERRLFGTRAHTRARRK